MSRSDRSVLPQALVALLAAAVLAAGLPVHAEGDAKQDFKDAGHQIAEAARSVGHGTKKVAKSVAHGTAQAVHAGAHKVDEAAKHVEHKTPSP